MHCATESTDASLVTVKYERSIWYEYGSMSSVRFRISYDKLGFAAGFS